MGIDSNINSNVNADPGAVGTPPAPVGAPPPKAGGPVVNPATISSIGPSQASPPSNIYEANDPQLQEALVTLVLASGAMTQFNLIGAFNTTSMLNNLIGADKVGGGHAALNAINQMSQIVTDMWEGFMQGIRETNDRRDAERKSPQYLDHIAEQRPASQKINTNSSSTEFTAYVNSLPAESRDRILAVIQRSESSDAWFSRNDEAINAFANSQTGPIGTQDDLKSVTVSSLVIGAPIISDYLRTADDPSTLMVATKVVQDGISSMPQPIAQSIPPDLGVFGALLVNGLINKATITSSVDSISQGEKPVDRKTAENYANRIIALVSGNGIENYINALVTHNMEQTDATSPEKVLEWTAAFKVILLSSALALVYKSETKHITDTEFEGMVNFAGRRDPVTNEPSPVIKSAEGSLEQEMVDLIAEQLGRIRPMLKKAMIAALYDYIATNPSMGSLMSPQVALSQAIGGMGGVGTGGGVAATAV